MGRWRLIMATYTLVIGGVTVGYLNGSGNPAWVANGKNTFSCDIISPAAAYRPAVDAESLFSENGTPAFGGYVTRVEESGAGREATNNLHLHISFVGYDVLLDRRFITETFAAGTTLKQILTKIVDDYLAVYGVTLSGSQVDGPALTEELVIDGMLGSAVLNNLSNWSEGYLWLMSPTKVLSMALPGGVAAPFDITDVDNPRITIGDAKVLTSSQPRYNKIYLKGGPDTVVSEYTQYFTGDGTTTTFQLDHHIYGIYPYLADSAIGYGVVDYDGTGSFVFGVNGYESLGGPDSIWAAVWRYDPVALTITREIGGAPGNGHEFRIRYDAKFPFVVTAIDQTAYDASPWEFSASYPDVTNKAFLQQIADSLLDAHSQDVLRVTYDTWTPGLRPGMTQNVEISDRNIDEELLITEVRGRSVAGTGGTGGTGAEIRYTIVLVRGTRFLGTFRDKYDAWLGGKTGGGSVGTGPGSASPASSFCRLEHASVSLTNAEFMAAADTEVLVVQVPAALRRIKVVSAAIRVKSTDGIWTNIDAAARLELVCSGWRMSGGVHGTRFDDLFGTAHDKIVDLPIPAMDEVTSDIEALALAGLMDVADIDSLYLSIDNNGAGAFTGGHDDNGVRLDVWYVWQDVVLPPVVDPDGCDTVQYEQDFGDGDASDAFVPGFYEKVPNGSDPEDTVYPELRSTEAIKFASAIGPGGENGVDVDETSEDHGTAGLWFEHDLTMMGTELRFVAYYRPNTAAWDYHDAPSAFSFNPLVQLVHTTENIDTSVSLNLFTPASPTISVVFRTISGVVAPAGIAASMFTRANSENKWIKIEVEVKPGTVTGTGDAPTSVAADGHFRVYATNVTDAGARTEIYDSGAVALVHNFNSFSGEWRGGFANANKVAGVMYGYFGMFGQMTKIRICNPL